MGWSWVCFEFNSPRRGINSLEGKPFGARSVTRLGWNVLGVFITLMERECRRWCPGRGGWMEATRGRGGAKEATTSKDVMKSAGEDNNPGGETVKTVEGGKC